MNKKSLSCIGLVIAILCSGPAWGTVETLPVVLSGDPAPGCPGRTFVGFHRVTINDNGQIMFGAQLDSSELSNNEGIWFGEPDVLELVIRKGDPAPGVPGRTISRFFINGTNYALQHQHHPQHNNSGQVVVVAYLDGPDPAEEAAIWKGGPGNLELIALAGDPAPGAPGRSFKWFHNPLIDDAGNVMFFGRLDNFDAGFWYHGDEGLVPIAVEGTSMPGLPGTVYTDLYMHGFDLAPTGEIVYSAQHHNEPAVYFGTPGAFEIVVSPGMEAPGVPGSSLVHCSAVRVRSGTELNIHCQFWDPTDLLHFQTALFSGPPDDLGLLVRRGDPVPDRPGKTFISIMSVGPGANSSGQTVFLGKMDPPDVYSTNYVIVAGEPGNWNVVVQTLMPAPGSGGEIFGGTQQHLVPPSRNESGIVAFEGRLPHLSRNGLWVWHDGELEAVAVARTMLTIGPGDERLLQGIQFVGDWNVPYYQSGTDGLNDRDEVAFDAAFLDGSRGIFVSGILTVSNEPPVCDDAQASIAELWPPNHKFAPATILGVSDPDGDEIELHIDAVTSDEPASGPGNPHAPDAFVDGSDTVQLRAERFGDGNGRVYEIRFTASDGTDSCEGVVRVAVPHDHSGDGAVDDGQDHNATDL